MRYAVYMKTDLKITCNDNYVCEGFCSVRATIAVCVVALGFYQCSQQLWHAGN